MKDRIIDKGIVVYMGSREYEVAENIKIINGESLLTTGF